MHVAAGICLLLAVAVQLLLNGQTFTNISIGIALASASVVLSVASARKDRSVQGTIREIPGIAVLAAIVVAILLVQLPSAYTHQRSFNRIREELRKQHIAPNSDRGAANRGAETSQIA